MLSIPYVFIKFNCVIGISNLNNIKVGTYTYLRYNRCSIRIFIIGRYLYYKIMKLEARYLIFTLIAL